MSQTFNIAVVGATGVVGELMLEILHERGFPVNEVFALASENSVGSKIRFGERYITVQDLSQFDFSQVQFAFFSAGSSISREYAPKAADAGAIVIDNTSEFRYEEDVPLVIPEVNPDALMGYRARNIIANPNCSTIQMLVALKPLYDAAGIARINVATYQSVAGAGRRAVQELAEQCSRLLNGLDVEPEALPHQIAFNVIPQIDVWMDNGYTKEEMKMVWETRKILGDEDIMVNPTAVRVPVFFGHSEAVHIETRQALGAEQAKLLLRDAPGVVLLEDSDYPTPVTHAANQDAVYVGRVRDDISHPCGINLWVVADNARKGAALNAIQIAETLINQGYYSA
jgi:aspartate-semialdehyde dehydrogenase